MRRSVLNFGLGTSILGCVLINGIKSSIAATETTVVVPANSMCTDSGINVQAGESMNLQSDGRASYGHEGSPVNDTPKTDPDGNRYSQNRRLPKKDDTNAIYPKAIGALVGRVGTNGNYFYIGSTNQITFPRSGRLFLCYNDVQGQYGNNSGAYKVVLSSTTNNSAVARSSLVKATVFNSVINQFRRTLTSDKALRLPLTIPAIYNKGVASIDGDRYVRIGRQAHCSNSCEYLSVSTSEPTQENLEWFRDHRNNNAESVDLRNDIVGFYDVNKDGSRGGAQNVMWQQDGKIIYLSMRLNSSRKEVIETARSMTSSQALISALPKPIDQISKTNSKCSADRIPVVIAPDRNRFPDGQTPSFAGRLGIYGDGKREDRTRIDPGTRCIFFREIANPSSARRTWLVIHGWLNNSQSTEIKELAEAVAKTNRNDRVLMLDWGEAAYNGGGNPLGIAQLSRGNYYAATWIRPVAEEAVNYLKNHYKINDEQAGSQLNLIGHSLGSLMSAEIGALYDQGVNALIALDPASEIDINDAIPGFNLGGYDVDGRTPAYSLNGILQIRSLNQGAVDRPRCFSNLTSTNAIKIADCNAGRRIARFSRAFVGKTSFAGNQSLAATADESFQIDFGERSDSPSSSNTIAREHGQVVKAFISRILGEGLIPTFLGIQDLSRHKDIKRDAYPYKLNPLSPSSPLWQFAHTGIITSSTDNAFTGFRLESLTKGKVSFSSIEYSTEDQNIYWENSTGRKIAGGSLLPGVFTLFSSIRPITTLVP